MKSVKDEIVNVLVSKINRFTTLKTVCPVTADALRRMYNRKINSVVDAADKFDLYVEVSDHI